MQYYACSQKPPEKTVIEKKFILQNVCVHVYVLAYGVHVHMCECVCASVHVHVLTLLGCSMLSSFHTKILLLCFSRYQVLCL